MARAVETEVVDDQVADEETPEVETVESDDSSNDSPFQQAFKAAKVEHSKPAEADDEHAQRAEVSTGKGKKAEAPPTRTGQVEPASAETTDDKPKSDPTALLSDEEFTALTAKHQDDPVALRRALEGAFTKKTQALAEQRKSTERLQQYADIIDAYEENPEATVRALAKELGITFEAPETKPTAEETDTTVDSIVAEFKDALGPELEYLADSLGPAITKVVERLTATTVGKATEPLKKQTETLLSKAAQEQTDTVMKAFGEKHPDWKTHEAAMFELSQRLQPNGTMTELEYLDHLYAIATRETPEARAKTIEQQVAEGVKAAIAKMTKGAETTETRTDATPERHVRRRATGAISFQEAHELAKQGIRLED